ncbi:unnamed protein product [Schistosoma turkestanicum]|nr:unnamed protein product [Schistosoma turkestanicum]
MSRKSIKKNNLSNSVPTLYGKDYDVKEKIYHQCTAKLLLQKKLKPGEKFDQADIAKLVTRLNKSRSQKRLIFVTENGLRMKAYKRSTSSYKRIFLSYQQIDTIYQTHNVKNLLIFGIVSMDRRIRAYECLTIEDDLEFTRFRTYVLKACENEERKLVGLNPIGTLSMSSLRGKKSSRGSLGSIVWKEPGQNDDENDIYQEELMENGNDVRRATLPYGANSSLSSFVSCRLSSDEGSVENVNAKLESDDTQEGSDPVHYHNGINDDYHVKTDEDVPSDMFEAVTQVEPILTPIFHADRESAKLFYRSGYEDASLDDNYEVTDLYPPSDWPAGVTFIYPDSVAGATISHLGPIYMYCERIVNDDNDYNEEQTAA